MIHLILVSHHPDIARGIAALAAQMSAAPETIHTAAGIDDADNPIGTDAVRIMQTLLEADNPDGILILVDLGSAILSAQTALDLLDDPALVARCRISAAPLVEGAISAAVAASSGADLETVAREATQALAAKQAALGETNAPASTAPVAVPSGDSATITLTNRDGLHARPAARLVAALTPYRARLILTCGDKQADGKSLNQLALLQARHGDRLTLHADGDDAAAALQTFRDLAAANFGDPADERDGQLLARATPATAATIRAAVWRCDPPQHDGNALHADRAAFSEAVTAVAARLETLQNQTTARLGAPAGDIFAAHAQLLAELAEATLAHDAANYAPVWQEETAQAAAALAALPDPYLRARAADIHDLAQQVLTLLADAPEAAMPDNAPFILVARDLYPLRAATLPANCLAVVLADGDPHSHAALLCQAAQRPYYSGAGDAVLALTDGAHIQITRASGEIHRLP
ncbi:dihydroxyacetone kinase phosphoryl donor subunit DhaM [Cardiobacterium hominis]|uniref:dihydroxyacetone kinase phosphoryl donor subunit DhaM n=1 Tax=Cardiobacterium hominis TaxID=2718 RepID=UPI0028E7FE5C|nr:dihydroxyacetone kinase phosphoryl donor subunit DhaM [Cardiobacterium hominis]